jgi:hypothetical protein
MTPMNSARPIARPARPQGPRFERHEDTEHTGGSAPNLASAEALALRQERFVKVRTPKAPGDSVPASHSQASAALDLADVSLSVSRETVSELPTESVFLHHLTWFWPNVQNEPKDQRFAALVKQGDLSLKAAFLALSPEDAMRDFATVIGDEKIARDAVLALRRLYR